MKKVKNIIVITFISIALKKKKKRKKIIFNRKEKLIVNDG